MTVNQVHNTAEGEVDQEYACFAFCLEPRNNLLDVVYDLLQSNVYIINIYIYIYTVYDAISCVMDIYIYNNIYIYIYIYTIIIRCYIYIYIQLYT